MTTNSPRAARVRQKARKELVEYFAIALYLCMLFGALLNYRRVALAEAGIPYAHYGYAIIEGLVLAKVILIGEVLRLGKRFESRPLIPSAVYRSFVFGVFVLIFVLLERGVHALMEGKSVTTEAADLLARPSVTVAEVLLVIFAFTPFFLLREAGRHLGEEGSLRLLFRRPGAVSAVSAGGAAIATSN